MEFVEFPKIARLSREVIVTEKIDGTNASVWIEECYPDISVPFIVARSSTHPYIMRAGSRTRFITPDNDNFGFAAWVRDNADELWSLGLGRHFGEWWGSGIQRGYGMTHKVFSLFNVTRWENDGPECCRTVPILYRGPFDTKQVQYELDTLRIDGSRAAPGFMKPEGVVVWHTAANIGFKKTIEKDELPKALAGKVA